MVTMSFPYALDAIGWKTYMINGAWDVLQILYVAVFWVETKGKTLEEVDEIFGGPPIENVPHLKGVLHGVEPGLRLRGSTDVVKVDADASVSERTDKA